MTDHAEVSRCSGGAHIQESLEQSRFRFDEVIQPDEEHGFELEPLDVLDINHPDKRNLPISWLARRTAVRAPRTSTPISDRPNL
ncbi:hypothetical protein D3C80_1861740 [compost metagenome]